MKAIVDYINVLQKNLETGRATEPSHYSALRLLIESLGDAVKNPTTPGKRSAITFFG